MRTILFKNGYLKIQEGKAEELFEDLAERGILWEYVSELFNKSVETKESESLKLVQEDIVNMQLNMESVLKMLYTMNSKMNVLPPPSQATHTAEQEIASTNIVEVKVKEVKPTGAKGKGILSKAAATFNSMGRK